MFVGSNDVDHVNGVKNVDNSKHYKDFRPRQEIIKINEKILYVSSYGPYCDWSSCPEQ